MLHIFVNFNLWYNLLQKIAGKTGSDNGDHNGDLRECQETSAAPKTEDKDLQTAAPQRCA
jgi:hypothetical protein